VKFLLICGASRKELLEAEANGGTVSFCITPGEELSGDNLMLKFEVDVLVRKVELTTEDYGGMATLHCEMSPEALLAHPELAEAGLSVFQMRGYEFVRHFSQAPNRCLVPEQPVAA
jgi:hypothetical protein